MGWSSEQSQAGIRREYQLRTTVGGGKCSEDPCSETARLLGEDLKQCGVWIAGSPGHKTCLRCNFKAPEQFSGDLRVNSDQPPESHGCHEEQGHTIHT